jgi:hypothetical protein
VWEWNGYSDTFGLAALAIGRDGSQKAVEHGATIDALADASDGERSSCARQRALNP